MRPTDGKYFSNISATTSAFSLRGGKYAAEAIATWGGGSAKLQRLGPDGSTYILVSSGTDFTANGYVTANLPAGNYKLAVATATGVYASPRRIPGQ